MTSKPEVFLTEEAWFEVLKIKAALSAEASVPLQGMIRLVAEHRMQGPRLDRKHPYVCGQLLLLFIGRLCLVHDSGHEVMLKYDQILELMLISVFSDAVVQVSFLATYEEVCGLPRSDPGQEIVSTPKKKPRETRLH